MAGNVNALRGGAIGWFALAFLTVRTAVAAPPAAGAVDPSNPQVAAEAHKIAQVPPLPPLKGHRVVEDRSGRKQIGKASIYSPQFQGKKMADGQRLDQRDNVVASKTLPLGTVAKLTNLDNGKTAIVKVEDHGPYVDGRTVDVTNVTADKLGITKKEGVAPVMVAPVAVPQPDGSIKPGAGALPGPATAE